MRYLGVDLGTRRIGLAISGHGRMASPLETLQAHPRVEENARAILKAADEYGADVIVIGLPLNMDDTEGPQAKLSRQLGAAIERLAPAGGPRVTYHDERLTSFAADQRLAGRDLTRKQKKGRQDAVAAQVMLQSYLESLPEEP